MYALAGTYVPELVVENVCGISTASDTLTVVPAEPEVSYFYLALVMKN